MQPPAEKHHMCVLMHNVPVAMAFKAMLPALMTSKAIPTMPVSPTGQKLHAATCHLRTPLNTHHHPVCSERAPQGRSHW